LEKRYALITALAKKKREKNRKIPSSILWAEQGRGVALEEKSRQAAFLLRCQGTKKEGLDRKVRRGEKEEYYG